MTAAERKQMAEHEAWISRPVRELFPPTGEQVTRVCRHCKKVYTRSVFSGKTRGFCTERCRDAWCNARRSPRTP